MKENITDIMHSLKLGQKLRTVSGKEYVFIEAKRTRAVVYDKTTEKEYSIKGLVEILEDRDEEVISKMEEEAVRQYQHERKVRQMVRGQHFIGANNKEYIFIKFNRTKLLCQEIDTKLKYTANPMFIKDILGKISQDF